MNVFVWNLGKIKLPQLLSMKKMKILSSFILLLQYLLVDEIVRRERPAAKNGLFRSAVADAVCCAFPNIKDTF